jgi:HPt (histidine-containing phosphotransfer) domain-containing protein
MLCQLLAEAAPDKAIMLLHTLKGNAGTLGGEALAASRLELACKALGGDRRERLSRVGRLICR